MESSRTYGNPPYKVVLVHGGPGASGYLAPLAIKLSEGAGVVEVLNSASTIKDQTYELYEEIIRQCDLPIILIGHSWGMVELDICFEVSKPREEIDFDWSRTF